MKYVKPKSPPVKPLNKIRACILSKRTLISSDSNIVFVCGAKIVEGKLNGRKALMEYAKRNTKHSRFFMAEKFFESFHNTKGRDLLSLEQEIANYSDCIIIVLESEGAFTELGAFSIDNKLVKMLLVINDKEHMGGESFISLGPIAKINKKSKFKPAIYIDLKSILVGMSEIEKRLLKIERKYGKTIEINTYNKLNSIKKYKMLFILDLISYFQPIKIDEIVEIFKYIYGNIKIDIKIEISLLESLGLIKKVNKYIIKTLGETTYYLRYPGLNKLSIRAEIINHYHRYSYNRLNVLIEK